MRQSYITQNSMVNCFLNMGKKSYWLKSDNVTSDCWVTVGQKMWWLLIRFSSCSTQRINDQQLLFWEQNENLYDLFWLCKMKFVFISHGEKKCLYKLNIFFKYYSYRRLTKKILLLRYWFYINGKKSLKAF